MPQPVAQSSTGATGTLSGGGSSNTRTDTFSFSGGEGTATVTYSSTAILSVSINSSLSYEINQGTRTRQVTFIGGNQYDIVLRNGNISIRAGD